MPAGTKVQRVFEALKQKGFSPGSAARIAQKTTGLALQTGKPPKRKRKSKGA
jgi:hypothetical protein